MLDPLEKKLLRDLREHRWQVITIVLVTGVGISCLEGFMGLYRDYSRARDEYYQQYRFADIFLGFRRTPRHIVEQVKDTPGLAHLEARIDASCAIEVEGANRRIMSRLLSMPEEGEPAINRIRLVEGRLPGPGGIPEVVVYDQFAHSRGLRPGDTIGVVIEGVKRRVTIVGLGAGPEFVYVINFGGGIVPDPRNSGVLWGRERYVEMVTDLGGACNSLVGTVQRDSDPRAVVRHIERRLEAWGVGMAITREGHMSHKVLRDELEHARTNATTLPVIFLAAAVLVLNLMLTRLVASQRIQIGTMKAIGVPLGRIVRHYLAFAWLLSILGSLFGIVGGWALSSFVSGQYRLLFHLPVGDPSLYPDLILGSLFLTCFAGFLGVIDSLRDVMRSSPAEAMRPAVPFAGTMRTELALTSLPLLWRIAIRNLLRFPFRTFVCILGVVLGTSFLLPSSFFTEAMKGLADFRFTVIERHDFEVMLQDEIPESAGFALEKLPGVARAEGAFHELMEVSRGAVSRRVFLVGLERDAQLFGPRTTEGDPIRIPDEGILISEKQAQVLGVRPGDQVHGRRLRNGARSFSFLVAGVYPANMGLEVYADIDWIRRLFGEVRTLSVVRVKCEDDGSRFEKELNRLPLVLTSQRRRDKILGFRNSLQKTMDIASYIFFVVAGVLSCGLNLNGALMILAERRRELALLRIQGFTRSEICDILLYEHTVIGITGVLGGVSLGYVFTMWAHSRFDTELYRLPWVLSRPMVAHAVLSSMAFALIAHLVMRRWVHAQDWRADLGMRE